VTITDSGTISTHGAGANGIFAQSIGGGGGLATGFAGSVGGAGSGGAILINHTGNITTDGQAAHGVFAQSAGGGSHLGGAVNLTFTGNITAAGGNSAGIVAQSIGADGGGNIHIETHGTVQGGSGSGAGVRFLDGATNTLVNHGTITTVSGVAGIAVTGTGGHEAIDNYGTVRGSVDLGAGRNAFTNRPSATFQMGSTVNLGAGNTLHNQGRLVGNSTVIGNVLNGGVLAPGNSTGRLSIHGSLTNLASATSEFEIGGLQQGTNYDLIDVTNFVQFMGLLNLSLVDNFVPLPTSMFTLMEFAAASGAFANVSNGERLWTDDYSGYFQVHYNATSLVVDDYYAAGYMFIRPDTTNMVVWFGCGPTNHYVIEYCGSLGELWTTVPTNYYTFPASNICQWIDDGTLTGGWSPSRFYRARLQ
jgi:hypothetical protein